MNILSSENIKLILIGLVCYAILDLASKHHLAAVHEVVHYILEIGHKRLFIKEIEVDQVISGYLYSDVAFDEVYETSHFYFVVEHPLCDFMEYVVLLLEKQDFVGGSHDQSFPLKQHHLTEILIVDFLETVVVRFQSVNRKSSTITVETIDLLFVFVVKAFLRKIQN